MRGSGLSHPPLTLMCWADFSLRTADLVYLYDKREPSSMTPGEGADKAGQGLVKQGSKKKE